MCNAEGKISWASHVLFLKGFRESMRLSIMKNNSGQAVAVEYAVIFLIVVAVIVAMTTYVNRSLQGRIHDARNYMYIQVNSVYNVYRSGIMPAGYEPYYVETKKDKDEYGVTRQFDTPWAGHEGKFFSTIDSVTGTVSVSNVLSAIYAQ